MWAKPKPSLAEQINRQCNERTAYLKSLNLYVWRESDERCCTVTVNGVFGGQRLGHQETLQIIGRSDVDLNARVLWSMDYAAGVVLEMRKRLKEADCGGK